jgi:hypothetical protein
VRLPRAVDVAVVGGGPAGFAAALAAARLGARTLLVERADRLGGNAALALVHTICGLYQPADAADAGEALPAQRGFALRFAEALARAGGAGPPERAGRVFVLPTEPARLAALALELCQATPGLELALGCELVAASLSREAGGCQRLRLAGPGGAVAEVEAQAAVDTSGDAALGALGGAELAQAEPDALQRPSYIVQLAGVESSELAGFAKLRVTRAAAGAARSGRLPPGCESVLVRRGLSEGEVYLTLTLPRLPGERYAPLEPGCLLELGARARRDAEALLAFLRETRPAFEKVRVAAWPQRVGVRETRRLVGRCALEREDVLAGRQRADEVAVSSWPIELWDDHRRARFEHPAGPCSVPLGALVSRSHPRLAMAGRCLSASHEALGALRVIGTALGTGEAAGVAAALAADAGGALGDIPAARVRDRIAALAEEELP